MPKDYRTATFIRIPPFVKTSQECSVVEDSIALTRSELIDTLDSSAKEREVCLALEAGKESSVLGGVCSNESDFTGSLKRYSREILADVVHEKTWSTMPIRYGWRRALV
jgi:hypothetical protein